MNDPDQPETSDQRCAPIESERTIPPRAKETHTDAASESTIPPNPPVPVGEGAGEPADQTIPPSSETNRTAETEVGGENDQTILPGRSAPVTEERANHDSNRFGDYEILQEIARGGMGVVYKARQISLNRTVALKKILSGQLAGEEDLKRFQVEAEASAQLDHVGIVPVYDFGQVDGQYFFSMGFVEGDDLAERIRERPMEAEAAATIMIKIAQAVGYANAKGVIHRDLKPSNVLLDGNNEPKVTDFGVAKQQGNDSELTAQGQILGTPSYMPPEQAAGQGDAVDQRSDVYALGAILYALLTGRPPFQAATAMETMIQVLDQDPVPISQLNSTIPRDLETICLKCLQKEPAKRYASAEALAEDLQRYLDDEPIVARPPTRTEQLGRWARKNKATAIGTGLVAATLIVATIISIRFAVEAGRQRDVAAEALAQSKAKAKDLQTVADFQATQISGIDLRAAGASLKATMIEKMKLDPKLTAGVDYTGAARDLLDEHIFDRTQVMIDQELTDQPLIQAQLLETMADSRRNLGLVDEAKEPQARALEIRVNELGADDLSTINTRISFGSLLVRLALFDEADEQLGTALDACLRTVGPEHSSTLAVKDSLGQLYSDRGLYEKSNEYIKEVLEVRRRTLGEDHEDTLYSYSMLETNLGYTGDLELALEYGQKVLEGYRAIYGEQSTEFGSQLNQIGYNLMTLGRNQESIPYFEKSLKLDQISGGHDNPDIIVPSNNLGQVLEEMGQNDKAMSYYKKSLEVARLRLGVEHRYTVWSLNLIGNLLTNMKKFEEALPYIQENIDISQRAFGEAHLLTAAGYYNLGQWYEGQEQYDKAIDQYKKDLNICRNLVGDVHGDTLITIKDIGDLYLDCKKYNLAHKFLTEAYEGYKQLYGPDHPDTKAAIESLVSLYEAWHQVEPDAGHDATAAEYKAQLGAIMSGMKPPATL